MTRDNDEEEIHESDYLGDKSEFCRKFCNGLESVTAVLAETPQAYLEDHLRALLGQDPLCEELRNRLGAFVEVVEAICEVNSAAISSVEKKLKEASSAIAIAWPDSLGTVAGAGKIELEIPSTEQKQPLVAFVKWLNGLDVPRRADSFVATTFLQLLAAKSWYSDDPNDASPLERSIGERFAKRIQLDLQFREWLSKGTKYPSGSVCTPILLSNEKDQSKIGMIMWLTVEVFRDGLTGFIPDLMTLGFTAIHENDSFLNAMDQAWNCSGLGGLGFSGRWRITNMPTRECSASVHERETHYLRNLQGKSAQAAALVAILAASGLVYSKPAAEEAKSDLPPSNLNPAFPITATIDSTTMSGSDPRTIQLGGVLAINDKLAAGVRFKVDDHPRAPSYIDTILVSAPEYRDQKKNPNSEIAKALKQEKESPKSYFGIHFQDCKTIGDALNWMLEVNTWKKAWNEQCQSDWEAQWGYAHDENRRFLLRDGNGFVQASEQDTRPIALDDMNNVTVEGVPAADISDSMRAEYEKRIKLYGVNTGTLEYMRNPIGGAIEHIQEDDESPQPSDDV